jgi:GT2 family glycosyltransferase
MIKKTAVIIITFNGMQWIEKCLNSCGNYPVILVDNASTDNTVAFIETHFPEVKLLKQDTNLGFGQANNIGMGYALNHGADYVFLLNQDAYLQPDVINKLVKTHNEYPEFGILSPIHLNGAGNKLDKNFANYLKVNDILFYDALMHHFTESIYDLPFVNAAAWLVPKATLLNIGGFDPVFYHYGEDDNYCQRILFHGLKVGAVPNTYIYHDRENKPNNRPVVFSDAYFKNKERYYKLYFANILIENKMDAEISKLKKIIFRLKLKTNFKRAHNYLCELNLLKGMHKKISKSRTVNKETGSHYLKIND